MKISKRDIAPYAPKPGLLKRLVPLGKLTLWAAVAAVPYIISVSSQNLLFYKIISMTYMIAGCLLFVAYLLVNGGVGRIDTDNIPRPDGMDDDAYAAHVGRVHRRKKYGQWIMIAALPLICIPLIDLVLMLWFPGTGG